MIIYSVNLQLIQCKKVLLKFTHLYTFQPSVNTINQAVQLTVRYW